jgi:transposase
MLAVTGVQVIGIDEHRWAPRGRWIRDGDVVEGRSATALASWLSAQPTAFAAGVEAITMDGFADHNTAAADVVPGAVTVMDPFHVVALAGAKLDLIRQPIQQQTLGRRGHTGDPPLRDPAHRPHSNPTRHNTH